MPVLPLVDVIFSVGILRYKCIFGFKECARSISSKGVGPLRCLRIESWRDKKCGFAGGRPTVGITRNTSEDARRQIIDICLVTIAQEISRASFFTFVKCRTERTIR